MTIQSPIIPRASEPFIDARTGFISRSWYLYLQNLISLINPSDGTIADLGVQVAFDTDNTTQVADLQWQIDHLNLDGDPFSFTNGEVQAVDGKATALEVATSFTPSSAVAYLEPLQATFEPTRATTPDVLDTTMAVASDIPFPTWWQQRDTIYSGESMLIKSGFQSIFANALTNNGNIFNYGTLAVL